jgi:holliday junction DNA helicase RuvA
MIAYLRGKVFEMQDNSLILDVQGVGYDVIASKNTLDDLRLDTETAVWVHTHVREDAFSLFGFSSKVEKHLFESLIKVNGIGPKLAIQILSGATLDQIIQLIENEDIKGLCQLPKVGKKTAEQMILSLRGKLVIDAENAPQASTKTELQSALAHLGFKPADIEKVLTKVEPKSDFEEQLRHALSLLGGR